MKSDVIKKCHTLIINGEFIVPNGKIEIAPGEFYGITSMTSVHIPDSVISIGKKAFCNCEALTSVHIPDGVIFIGYEAFYGCKSLTSITYRGTHTVRCIDGFCIELGKSRSVGEYTIYRAQHFETGEKCRITEKDGFYAFGNTVKQAVQNLNFKLCEERGIEQINDFTLLSKE